MSKIVSGKILSIETSIIQKKGTKYNDTIDTLEYFLTLENGESYKTSSSMNNLKVNDYVDIMILDTGNVILNKKTAKKILFDSKLFKFYKYFVPLEITYTVLTIIKNTIINGRMDSIDISVLAIMLLVIPFYIFYFLTDNDIVYDGKNKEILNKYIKEEDPNNKNQMGIKLSKEGKHYE